MLKRGRDKGGIRGEISGGIKRVVIDLAIDARLVSYPHSYTPPAMPPSPPARKARLLYCKAHVAIHPTAFKGDNVPGYLGLVEVHGGGDTAGAVAGAGLLVSWVPDEVLARMDEQDREGYRRVGEGGGEGGEGGRR